MTGEYDGMPVTRINLTFFYFSFKSQCYFFLTDNVDCNYPIYLDTLIIQALTIILKSDRYKITLYVTSKGKANSVDPNKAAPFSLFWVYPVSLETFV